MNYAHSPLATSSAVPAHDVHLRPGDGFEVFGKTFVIQNRSSNPPGFVVSDPDSAGTETIIEAAHIKDWWQQGKLRVVVRDDYDLSAGVRESLRRTLRAFKASERAEMFRRLRYCQAIDALGPDASRSKASLQPVCDKVAAERGDTKSHSWSSVYRWWRDWSRAGRDIRALNPSTRRRGNRSSRLPDYMQAALEVGRRDWLQLRRSAMSSSYKKVVHHCVQFHGGRDKVDQLLEQNPESWLWPSYRTFVTYCNATGRTQKLVNRHSADKARQDMYPVGTGPEATYPFERVEADFKYLRLFVVDDRTGLPLGTPYLMAAVDCYSGMVAGYDIGFDPPSYLSAARCLKHIISYKTPPVVEDEDLAPIRGSYPVNGVPYQFFIDNDAAFHAESFEASARALGCHINYIPPGEHWKKGKIERLWQTIQTAYLDLFPGKALRIGQSAAKEYDPIRDAVITLSQLRYVLYKAFVDVHHEGQEPNTFRKRIDLWNEGVAVHPPRPARDHNSVVELVGAYTQRKVDRRGIALFGLRYNSSDLAIYRDGFKSDPRVDIRYDPQDISRIWVIDAERGITIKVRCTRRDYAEGLSEHQHRVIRRHALDGSGINAPLTIKKLMLAKVELLQLGEQIIKNRGKTRPRKAIARFLGIGHDLINERGKPITDDAEVEHVDLEIDDEPIEDFAGEVPAAKPPRKRKLPAPEPVEDDIDTPLEPEPVQPSEPEPHEAPVEIAPMTEVRDEPPPEQFLPRPTSRRQRDRTMRISNGRS